MTRRPIAALLACCALQACGEPPAQRERTPTPDASSAAFSNTAAKHSIMQPEVIAETEPTPAPTPTAAAPLPSATIAFPSGVALDDAGLAALDRLLGDAALPEQARFVLRGSSDSMGSDADNLLTSRRRAEAVRKYLVDKGVAADRIEVIALGERRPVAPNATRDGADDPAGRARNRRVEIEVIAPATVDAAPAQAAPTPSAD